MTREEKPDVGTDTAPADTPSTAPHHRGEVTELDPSTCWQRLRTAQVARVVHVVDGHPRISLVNYGLDGEDVVVRSTEGTRLHTALTSPTTAVLVEVDEVDETTRSGWSVVVQGRMAPVLDQVTVARLDRTVPASWVLGDTGGTWLRLTVESLSGRQVGGAVG